jgi:putative heme-binding domain-containing protein
MPYLGEKGRAKLDSLIGGDHAANRLTAFRAIRRTDGAIDDLPYARKLANDSAPEVRAEAAQAMRNRNFDEARDVLVAVASQYDGKDRSYLESLGIGAGHNTEQLWKAIGEKMKPGAPLEWSDTFARLTWRLMPEAAVPSLKARASGEALSAEQRKLAVDSIAFIKSKASAEALMDLAAADSPLKEQVLWWLKNRSEGEWSSMDLKTELKKRGLIGNDAEIVEITVPEKPQSTKFTVAEVMALKGDASKGKMTAGRCIMCHKIGEAGPDYGPALKGFASRQPPEVVAKSIIEPSADISHGFEGSSLKLKNGKRIDGHIVADGNPVVIQSTGGVIQRVPKGQISERKDLDRSLMLGADQLGLSAQDVADVVEWLKTY